MADGEDQHSSELNLAGRERLVLHDHSAAGGQNHDVQVLLLLMGLLVPVPGHLCVMGWNQSHLMNERRYTFIKNMQGAS